MTVSAFGAVRLFKEGLGRDFIADEAGATSIEYGLIVALIFLAIVGAVRGYTDSTSEMYSDISSTLNDATN